MNAKRKQENQLYYLENRFSSLPFKAVVAAAVMYVHV